MTVRKILRNELRGIDLTLYDENQHSIEIGLEPWQIKAVVKLLGINLAKLPDGRFEVIMYPQNLVEEITEKLPKYQWVE